MSVSYAFNLDVDQLGCTCNVYLVYNPAVVNVLAHFTELFFAIRYTAI